MCRTCGCDDHVHTRPRTISIETDLLAANDRLAEALRARFEHERVTAFNLIGAPGAGKTTLLEHTIRALPELVISVIEGDQATDHDARRIAATGSRAVQVNTGPGCHLDAQMIERGLRDLAPPARSLLFIENVGNLVCPALFDLGEAGKVVVVSVTEGEDKPLKYPHVYRAAAAMVITKIDLAPHVDVDPARLVEHARHINPHLHVFPVVLRTAGRAPDLDGLGAWCDWLRSEAS